MQNAAMQEGVAFTTEGSFHVYVRQVFAADPG